jgi:hypothetical protein
MRRATIGRAAALLGALLAGQAAWAWGDEGHEIVAAIAYARMTKAARAAADALLATDRDTLTGPDFVSRATWADRWRDADRATTRVQYEATHRWHYVNIEIDGGTLAAACNHHPPLPPGVAASQGPADDCVVDKIAQFSAELKAAATPPAEKLLALKYLIHFVGDLHQPLHASDRHDGGGNALPVLWGDIQAAENLHAYWDRELVLRLGHDPRAVARALNQAITGAQSRAWGKGKPADWASESWRQAKAVAYDFSGEATAPDEHGVAVLKLDAVYEQRALPVLRAQLSRAGVRLARLLDAALK